ncbi:VOC family protein [Streptomyces sp. NPDC004542]|uniref:VOC family protein n=1 Tax=Streptomyces sp. NPDC004542 TaxID=3154281 RepID=UPI0033BB7D93
MTNSATAGLPARTSSRIRSLGYIGLTATDLDAWRTFATDVCGLQISARSTEEQLLLRADERSWRISVTPGDGRLTHVGWEVAGKEELDLLAAELDAAGVAVDDPGTADERGVTGLIRAKDPAGNQLEFFYGAKMGLDPFVSPRGITFVTGDQGLGHVVLAMPDMAEAQRFYLDILRFRVSDWVNMGPFTALFTHVNPRHHSFAMAPSPGPAMMHHFMLEVADLDMVGRTYDLVTDGAAPLTSTLGKHTNDQMVSFYMQTPSACQAEYGWSGRPIDDATWTTVVHDKPSIWGHRQVGPGPGAPQGG